VPPSQWTELDDCGNTVRARMRPQPRHATYLCRTLTHPRLRQALHVAVLRRNKAAVALLLECGFPPQEKSALGWAAVYEAVAARDQPLVLMLHTATVRHQEDAYRCARRTLHATPDPRLMHRHPRQAPQAGAGCRAGCATGLHSCAALGVLLAGLCAAAAPLRAA
jgi:hypothetical protein